MAGNVSDSGGAVFPFVANFNNARGEEDRLVQRGMSLRDRLAESAMKVILQSDSPECVLTCPQIADQAYEMADAMIARSKW